MMLNAVERAPGSGGTPLHKLPRAARGPGGEGDEPPVRPQSSSGARATSRDPGFSASIAPTGGAFTVPFTGASAMRWPPAPRRPPSRRARSSLARPLAGDRPVDASVAGMTIHDYMAYMERKSVLRAKTPGDGEARGPLSGGGTEERPSSRGSSRAQSRQGVVSPHGADGAPFPDHLASGAAPRIDLWGPTAAGAAANSLLGFEGPPLSIGHAGHSLAPAPARSDPLRASAATMTHASSQRGSEWRPGSVFYGPGGVVRNSHEDEGAAGVTTAPVVPTDLSSLSPELFTPRSPRSLGAQQTFNDVLPEAPYSPLGVPTHGDDHDVDTHTADSGRTSAAWNSRRRRSAAQVRILRAAAGRGARGVACCDGGHADGSHVPSFPPARVGQQRPGQPPALEPRRGPRDQRPLLRPGVHRRPRPAPRGAPGRAEVGLGPPGPPTRALALRGRPRGVPRRSGRLDGGGRRPARSPSAPRLLGGPWQGHGGRGEAALSPPPAESLAQPLRDARGGSVEAGVASNGPRGPGPGVCG